MESTTNRTLGFIADNWYTKKGLIVCLIFIFVLVFYLSGFFYKDTSVILIESHLWITKIVSSFVACFIVFVYWFFSTKYPKKNKNKIGILIAIRDDDDKSSKIKNDIIEQLNTIITNLSCGPLIEVIGLPNQLSKNITSKEKAQKISDKTGCQFIIHGKLREYNGDFEFFPEFLVRHKPLKDNKLVAQGFSDALVNKQWRFLEKETLDGIHITANNIREICLYILGIASHQSYDFNVSKTLHLELLTILRQDDQKRKELSHLFAKLPNWISDSLVSLSVYENFVSKDTQKAKELLDESLQYNPINFVAIQNLAFCIFELGDITGAKKMIGRLKRLNSRTSIQDVSWRYSEAFLLFLEGKYELGLRSYKKAFYGRVTPFSISTALGSIRSFLIKNPEKIQFKFALCHILIKQLDNFSLELSTLEKFYVEAKNRTEMSMLVPITKTYLEESYRIGKIKESDRINY